MPFNQGTRNRLQRFVNDARSLLVDEFTRQLQQEYGLDPKTGEAADLSKLSHLDDSHLETARVLREILAHYLASEMAGSGKKIQKDVLDRIVREQAFTVLNRLAALRMMEARGLLRESIANGYQSQGFQLYERLAGHALGETGDGYRCYVFSLFDEFALDLKVLFDRHNPQGMLFPGESAVLQLLDLLNEGDMEALWGEDETIGWLYQYFNSTEERKKMRKESAAPRNSRELAVRNQFFTPRYVVEFLTDNTLGRIGYEMARGQTRLADQCRYLVRRPTEIFLAEDEAAPEALDQEGLSQEELLRQPVHIPHRPLKDPREIRLLDPACGSMHFGLYAFDLFETTYEEAWDNGSCPALQDDYASKDEFLKDIPRLIIEHNIHGIDIDPRAVQIAGLSLWLRAQKAWQAQGVKPADRPRVHRSNIVCAEPMPGGPEMLEDFAATLDPPLLGELVKTVFEKMHLAGEAGSLLKIEEEIRTAIDTARKEWLKQQDDLFTREDGSHGEFFETAEQQVIAALRAYAEQADADSYQRRLFADDAARGFAFIDVCRKRYDAVVMNPPFGEPSMQTSVLLEAQYSETKADIDAAFVDRSADLLYQTGRLGGIYNRTQFFKGYLPEWRDRNLLIDRQIDTCVDLGLGVLDGAMVEAAAYATSAANNTRPAIFISALANVEKELAVDDGYRAIGAGTPGQNCRVILPSSLLQLPAHRVSYWVAPRLLQSFKEQPPLEGTFGYARQGLITSDNERFLRLIWEVPVRSIANSPSDSPENEDPTRSSSCWFPYAKGGDYSPFFGDIHLVVNWRNDGREICNFFRNGRLASRPQNTRFYQKAALTYTERTASDISPRAMPEGCIFDCKGPIISPSKSREYT